MPSLLATWCSLRSSARKGQCPAQGTQWALLPISASLAVAKGKANGQVGRVTWWKQKWCVTVNSQLPRERFLSPRRTLLDTELSWEKARVSPLTLAKDERTKVIYLRKSLSNVTQGALYILAEASASFFPFLLYYFSFLFILPFVSLLFFLPLPILLSRYYEIEWPGSIWDLARWPMSSVWLK